MLSFLHNYVHTLISAALICAVALILTPEGRGKKTVEIVCGVAVITVMLSPLVRLDFSEYSKSLADYKISAQKYADSGAENRENLNRLYIQEQCQAYILDKAENAGVDISSVRITAEWSNEGYWYPVKAEIRCSCAENAKQNLQSVIESELGISRESQKWSSTNE